MAEPLAQGTVHSVGADLQEALERDDATRALWQGLTPLGRNEFICWVDDAKTPATRLRRIGRTVEELHEGKRRPCCWPGCVHRPDKPPSPSQRAILIEGRKR